MVKVKCEATHCERAGTVPVNSENAVIETVLCHFHAEEFKRFPHEEKPNERFLQPKVVSA